MATAKKKPVDKNNKVMERAAGPKYEPGRTGLKKPSRYAESVKKLSRKKK
jgi:hypothetical protein